MELNNSRVYFVGFKGLSLTSKIITFFTRGEYSHVAYLNVDSISDGSLSTTDGNLIEFWGDTSSIFNTIKQRIRYSSFDSHTPDTEIDILSLPVNKEERERIDQFHYDAVKNNMDYNWKGVFTFLLGKDYYSKDKKFCSEFCWEALQQVGQHSAIHDMPACRVSPSNFMHYIKIYGAKLELSGKIGPKTIIE